MYSIRRVVFTLVTLLVLVFPVLAQPPLAWGPPVRGPQLGVFVDNVSFEKLDSLKLPYGVRVTRLISGSPAEVGGLRAGDILLTIDGEPVFSVARLRWLMGKTPPDAHLKLKYHRDGESSIAEVVLRGHTGRAAPPPRTQGEWHRPSPSYLGVSLQSLTEGLREALTIPAGTGVLVAEVYEGGPAEKAALRPGDVILKMDRRTIRDIDDVERVLDYFEPGEQVRVDIIREQKQEQFTVTLGERKGPRALGRWREGVEPYNDELPVFADPGWWRKMEEFIKRWRYFWEYGQHEAPRQSL